MMVVLHGTYHNWPWRVISDGEPAEWRLYIYGAPGMPAPESPKLVPVGSTREDIENYMAAQGYGR